MTLRTLDVFRSIASTCKKGYYAVGRFYSYTEKIQQKRTRKTKQKKTMYSKQLYTITILTLNKSIQAVQLIY